MTSWKKRISNVPEVINSILRNSTKPDKIVLNLSLDEFPNREFDLPQEVQNLQSKGIIEIGWQEGNTKAFKKIIPTLKKYPHDAIIAIDDDLLYPEDFIQTFIEKHTKLPHHPLSGNYSEINGVKAHCGCSSLVKAEYFGYYLDELITDDLIKLEMDDVFYTYCADLNRCCYKFVGKKFSLNMPSINSVEGISDVDLHVKNEKTENYLIDAIRRKYNIDVSILYLPHFVYK